MKRIGITGAIFAVLATFGPVEAVGWDPVGSTESTWAQVKESRSGEALTASAEGHNQNSNI